MKGSILDILVIMVWILLFAVFTMIAFQIISVLKNDPSLTSSMDPKSVEYLTTSYNIVKMVDGIFAFATFALFLAVLITAYYIQTHPGMFIIALTLLLINLALAGTFANVYYSFVTSASESSGIDLGAEFPLIHLIFKNFPTIVFVFAALLVVLMYGKQQQV